jgi:hypothetical protein
MQMTAPTGTSERSPLSVVWDVIVAPKSAFEALDQRPRWLLVYLLICVLGIAGALLQVPAGTHVGLATIDRQAVHDPGMASMTPAQLENIKSVTTTIQRFVWIIYPVMALVAISIAAAVLLIGNAIGRGRGTFAKYFALAANVGIIQIGIAYFLTGLLSSLHPPDTFNSTSDILRLLPSLAWIAPSSSPKLTVLLEAFNPFTIWSFALLALGLQRIGGLSAPIAYGTAFLVGFGNLLFAVPFAQ